MEKSLLLRKAIFAGIFLLLVLPVLHLLYHFPMRAIEWDPFLFSVAGGALLQALLSTVITLLLSLAGCFGFFFLRRRCRAVLFRALTIVSVLPAFVPPIFLVVIGARSLGFLPHGLWGVVFFHCLMNSGLISFLFYRNLSRQTSAWAEWAEVAGVGAGAFLWRVVVPRSMAVIKEFFFYLFILYFFSFSIPFLVGGSFFSGLEVFIYEKIMFWGKWSEAIQYSLAFFLGLLFFSFFLSQKEEQTWVYWDQNKAPHHYLSFAPSLFILLTPMIFLTVGFVISLIQSFAWMPWQSLYPAIVGTLLVSFLAGWLCFLFLSLLSFCFIEGVLSQMLLSLVHPSWVVVGFSFLLIGGDGLVVSFIKYGVALTLIYLPFLYRMGFHNSLQSLSAQVQVAGTFPVSWRKTFFTIIWPQCLQSICLLSGVAAVWAAGDFALSEILLSGMSSRTLAFDMKNYLSSYRLNQAVDLLLPLLAVSIVVFFVFQGIYYVSRRKTLS